MVNEEIVTALRNSINNGDSLQSAIQIMINSGYDSREVHEASQFVGGVTSNIQAIPQEQQMMQRQRAATVSQQRMPQQQTPNSPIIQPSGKPPKKSYLKEIILVFTLLILIGALTLIIIYKDTILGWFS